MISLNRFLYTLRQISFTKNPIRQRRSASLLII